MPEKKTSESCFRRGGPEATVVKRYFGFCSIKIHISGFSLYFSHIILRQDVKRITNAYPKIVTSRNLLGGGANVPFGSRLLRLWISQTATKETETKSRMLRRSPREPFTSGGIVIPATGPVKCEALTLESVDLGLGAGVHVRGAFFELRCPLASYSCLVVLEFQLRRHFLVLAV